VSALRARRAQVVSLLAVDRNEHILAVANEAQRRIDDALARMTSSEIEGSGFDQAGLRDGAAIVADFVHVGEFGLALEHVLYMVTETGVTLTSSSAFFLERTAATLGFSHPPIMVAD